MLQKILDLFESCDLDSVTGTGSRQLGDFNANLYYKIPRFGHGYIGMI